MPDTVHKTDKNIESAELICGSSPLPAAVIDQKGNIIYKNSAFEKMSEGNITALPKVYRKEAYEGYISAASRSFKIFVSPLDSEKCLVNMIVSSSLDEGFMTVLSACVRKAAGNVAHATDAIARFAGIKDIAPPLNEINEEIMILLSEILIPEQIILLRQTEAEKSEIVSLSESMEEYADEISEIFPSDNFSKKFTISPGIYTRADTRAIKLILTDFFAKGFEFEHCMEGINLTLERYGAYEAILSLSCGHLSPEPQVLSSKVIPKPEGYEPVKELMEILSSKFGCGFTVTENPAYSVIKVTVPMEDPDDIFMLRASVKRYVANNSFSDEKAIFARYGIYPRYKYTDDIRSDDK